MIIFIFFVLLIILIIHIFYKFCVYKSMLSLGKYDFPIDISFNELYKWDKLYQENKDLEVAGGINRHQSKTSETKR